MPKTKVALTLDRTLLEQVDELVARRRFRNRSQAIETALLANHGNRTHTARQLGISVRTLQYRLRDYGLQARSEGSPR